jgi:hypothetical protein
MYQVGFVRHANPRRVVVEEIRIRREVRCPDHFLLLGSEVASEALDPVREHPDAPVGDFDVREDVGNPNLSCWPCDVSSASGASAQM